MELILKMLKLVKEHRHKLSIIHRFGCCLHLELNLHKL